MSANTELSNENQDAIRFIEEYRLCCEDWSNRDAYVQQKFFNVAIVLFAVVVAIASAISQEPTDSMLGSAVWIVYAVIFLLLGIYMLIALISTIKDIYYRDGSELLLYRLQRYLPGGEKLSHLISELESQKKITSLKRGRSTIENPRKLKASSISSLGISDALERFLASRGTYRWIVRFYAIISFCCLSGSAYCVVRSLL